MCFPTIRRPDISPAKIGHPHLLKTVFSSELNAKKSMCDDSAASLPDTSEPTKTLNLLISRTVRSFLIVLALVVLGLVRFAPGAVVSCLYVYRS